MSLIAPTPTQPPPAISPDTAAPQAAYIGIGANLGDAHGNVLRALQRLTQLPDTQLVAQSTLFRTAPIDAGGDDYINAVVRLDTGLSPESLLAALQQLELEFGRIRPYRNAPRTLDLDILLYGDQVLQSAALDIPHPRMTQRAFVLLPLLQIAPLACIPGLGAAQQFLADVADQRIQPL